MKWNIAAIISIAFLMLISGAVACHYWCSTTGINPDDPGLVVKDATIGQTLTFAGADSQATYAFVVRDENAYANVIAQGTILPGGQPWTWTVPSTEFTGCGETHYYAVTWTADRGSLDCVLKDCIKIKVTAPCVTCPTYPSECKGLFSETSTPTVATQPWMTNTGAIVSWDLTNSQTGTGNPATFTTTFGYNNLPAGTWYPTMRITLPSGFASKLMQTCNGNPIVVKPMPTGGASVS